MNNLNISFSFVNFISSFLTAFLIISPFLFQAIPALKFNFLVLFAYVVVTIISWVVTLCSIDDSVAKGGE